MLNLLFVVIVIVVTIKVVEDSPLMQECSQIVISVIKTVDQQSGTKSEPGTAYKGRSHSNTKQFLRKI